ncbi:RIP metalloprotease RseP [Piscinibacter sakaiensis]|uniref:Zinc metalloprotease n=1 Tax=Piscinibacter sakaiensis TaxID=1547922 RepID=A0A0K8P706_PISS1|nr:RIP metalloprotease RseP [Piscinibacter sakaiensis]GAP38396.1 membrane-associated zinc metalloprotease [Piscinibacter sakaiensis]
MILTVLAFVLTLAVLIVIHEYGHYRVAVACGVKVLRFSVGFGRVLWRRQATPASTEFVVSALPFGGYVRMLDEREGPVAPAERDAAFNRKPLWQRAAIVAAGPAANLGLAVLLYAAAHWIGVDEPKALLSAPAAGSLAEQAGLRAGDWVREASSDGSTWRDVRSMTDLRWSLTQAALQGEAMQLAVTDAAGRAGRTVTLDLGRLEVRDVDAALMRRIGVGSPYSEPVLGEVKAGGAAARAGLQAGDRVLAIDGRPVEDAASLRERIRQAGSGRAPATMDWRIERAGERLSLAVTPAVAFDREQRIGRIEAYVGRPPEMVTVRYGLVDGVSEAVGRTWDMSVLTLRMLGRMVIGEASLKNLSGPLTIADYAGQSVRLGMAYYLGFLAVVSISLGVLNLLPLPMLDGGHLMYYLFEAVTGRPVSELWLDRLQRGGVAIMLMMMSLALYNDVARLLGLH